MSGKRRVVTEPFTASFPHLFEAKGIEGMEPRFSVSMVFDKGADLTPLHEAIEEAIKEGMGNPKKFQGMDEKALRSKLQLPIKEGDENLDRENKPRPEFAGRQYAVAAAKQDNQPKLVDQSLNPILDQKEIYGGVRLRAAVVAYSWKFGGKVGVSFHLDNVQKVGDGEAFGTTVSAEDDFGSAG